MEYSNIEDILNEMELYGLLGLDGAWLLDHPMCRGYFRVNALSRPITYSYGGPPYFKDFNYFKRVQLLHHGFRERNIETQMSGTSLALAMRLRSNDIEDKKIKHK